MTSLAHLDQYHDCKFCHTMVIDPDRGVNGEKIRMGSKRYAECFFFEPTLDAVITAARFCPFANWLCAGWSRQRIWKEHRMSSTDILVCGSLAFENQLVGMVSAARSKKGRIQGLEDYVPQRFPILVHCGRSVGYPFHIPHRSD